MSHIAEKIYNEDLTNWLEGSNSLDELIEQAKEDYGFDNIESAYFLILNPDHPSYDEKLSSLEIDFEAVSVIAFNSNTKAGFVEDKGEVGRVILFPSKFSENQLQETLNTILFDYLILK